MKHSLSICLALLALQAAAPEVEITAEPHHHLALENKSVRVFNVDVAPQSETLMHWHRHDYIAVNLGAAEVINAVKDKPPLTVKLQDGQTGFSSATFAHIARNSTDQPFRNVTIEILDDQSLRNSPSPWDPKKDEDRALETFPGGTQQILFVKDAIRVSEFELQPGATVPKQHHTGSQLLVAVTDLTLGSKPPSHLKSGDSKWLPANDSDTITNTGPTPAKFVTLEFP